MQNLTYLIAMIIGGVAGYQGLEWYYIFIGGVFAAIGYLSERPELRYKVRKRDGEFGYLKLFLGQVVAGSLLPAITYYIALQFR
jgi:hypothetical protein